MKTKNKYILKKCTLKLCIILVVILIICGSIYFWTKKIEPIIVSLADSKARSVALKTTNTVINEYFSNMNYKEFIELVENDSNKVISVKTDTLKLNKISSEISLRIQENLLSTGDQIVNLNLGSITGNKLLYKVGPNFKIKVTPFGNVSAKFISSFQSAGINQTIHKINLQVTTKVVIVAPFISKYQEYVYDINIVETIIIGDVPSTYYNVTGVDGLDQKDTLNMFE